jgi:hypothetical protein
MFVSFRTSITPISQGAATIPKKRPLKRKAPQLEETSEIDGDAAPAPKKVAIKPNLKHNPRNTRQVVSDTDIDEVVDPAPKVKEPRKRIGAGRGPMSEVSPIIFF